MNGFVPSPVGEKWTSDSCEYNDSECTWEDFDTRLGRLGPFDSLEERRQIELETVRYKAVYNGQGKGDVGSPVREDHRWHDGMCAVFRALEEGEA